MATQEAQTLIIRDITEISEMREVEQLQKEVWGVADREVFPALALIPMIEVGGVLIGAFDGDRMAGFVFGFMGQENGKAILHSDMLAVREEYRRHGLGYQLKLAQRERALANGVDTITWTFDPLQARNARLNFGKLGVLADRYRVNYYGETTSFLHQSGTDRLWVTWELNQQRVQERIAGGPRQPLPDLDVVTVLRVDEKEEPIVEVVGFAAENVFALEIPADINQLLASDAALAPRWREATRASFTKLIDAGLSVCEFNFIAGPSGKVGQYLLQAITIANG